MTNDPLELEDLIDKITYINPPSLTSSLSK